MTGGTRNQPPQSPTAVAMALSKAFPGYEVVVRWDWNEPRYQLRTRDGSNPYCIISPDPDEIRAELEGQ